MSTSPQQSHDSVSTVPVVGNGQVKRVLRFLFHRGLDILSLGSGLPANINNQRWRLSPQCWRAFPPNYEQATHSFFSRALQAGTTVLDVGAHVGIHTLALSHLVGAEGHVFAFEPVPSSARLLLRHLRMNRIRNATVVQAAVGASEGAADFEIGLEGPDPGNSFVSRPYVKRKGVISVPIVSLDEFCKSRNLNPGLIKIDAEGYELEVLRGCARVFAAAPTVKVVCAIHPWHLTQLGQSEHDFFAFCDSLKFRVLTLGGEPTEPLGTYREVLLVH